MLTEQMRKTFSALLTNHLVVINQEPELEEWKSLGEPRCLIEVERENGFVAAIDAAYGLQIIFSEDGKFCSWGHHETSLKNDETLVEAVCLDKNYYGVSKYLWF